MYTASLPRGPATASWARIINVILGVWLFISVFVWPHSSAQMTNTWILGVLEVIFSLVAIFATAQARYLNTVLAIWLFISAFALPSTSAGTIWNNVIVAILTFVFSLVPGTTQPHGGLRHATV